MDLSQHPLLQLAHQLAIGVSTALRATEEALDQLSASTERTNCLVALRTEQALRDAHAADRMRASGDARPLLGVPLAHKDILYRKGEPATAGSRLLDEFRPETTAGVLKKLDAAGALHIGRLSLSEFARSPTGFNEAFGSVRNPWNHSRISGGSSSGSAAAVASGAVAASLGTDTGGSIRIPAAICGLVGLKPTYGLVGRSGVFPVSWSLDTVGPIAKTARDCALLMQAIAGPDADDPSTSGRPLLDFSVLDTRLEGLRVGRAMTFFEKELDPSIGDVLSVARDDLQSSGALMVRSRVVGMEAVDELQILIREVEAASVHAAWIRRAASDYAEQIRARMAPGFGYAAVRYAESLRLRGALLKRFVDAAFADADVLMTPAIPIPTPTIAETLGDPKIVASVIGRIGSTVRHMGFLGLPAVTVPCGFDDNGMPVGFQLIGRPFADARLLGVAAAFQERTEWHLARPPTARPAPPKLRPIAQHV